jgi:pimeloyl-ACP methyl ester carboxylesterase
MESLPAIAARIGDGQIAQRFDLIGFDPRGVGASTPTIYCLTPAERDAARAALPVDISTRAGTARYKAEANGVAAKCADRTGRDVLAHVGTRDVVRDLDVLRAALGDTQLTYLGYSYGTQIGAAYAEAFPTTVRALVLDGAIDPAQTAEERDADQGAAFTRAFEAFAADCTTQPDCPLGSDPKTASERFDTLVTPLTTHPARTRDGQRTLSARDAATARTAALQPGQLGAASGWPHRTRRRGRHDTAQAGRRIPRSR